MRNTAEKTLEFNGGSRKVCSSKDRSRKNYEYDKCYYEYKEYYENKNQPAAEAPYTPV